MARETFIVCDGCGDREAVARPEGESPPSFVSLKVAAGSWGDAFELCTNCYNRLLEKADPRKWPRAEKALRS